MELANVLQNSLPSFGKALLCNLTGLQVEKDNQSLEVESMQASPSGRHEDFVLEFRDSLSLSLCRAIQRVLRSNSVTAGMGLGLGCLGRRKALFVLNMPHVKLDNYLVAACI